MKKEITTFEKLSIVQTGKKTNPVWIEQTRLRGGTFNTVEIGYVELELHKQFPLWDFEIVDDKQIDGHIVVKGKLTVKSPDGKMSLIKMQYGSSEVKKMRTGEIMDLANDYKAAASDALKKCASLLGIAFDVYHPKVYQKLLMLSRTVPSTPNNSPKIAEIGTKTVKTAKDVIAEKEALKTKNLNNNETPPDECNVCHKKLTPNNEGGFSQCSCLDKK